MSQTASPTLRATLAQLCRSAIELSYLPRCHVDATNAEHPEDAAVWVDSESFLPTAPGLYRARYVNGKLVLNYAKHECNGAADIGL